MSKFSTELEKTKHKTTLRDLFREKMDDESYKDFEQALSDRSISVISIINALKAFEIEVSENTVRRWRKSL